MRKEQLTDALVKQMEYEKQTSTFKKFGFDDNDAYRRDTTVDKSNIWRTPFVRDSDKILHCPFYSRYADKTQVYSLWKNDDITRRFLHVQFVSRIARTIGGALHLNQELIESIALGHDIGHPAFAHSGEKYLDELYRAHTGRRFLHNIHSVRVLDKIYSCNLTLQTLDGIAAHNGEIELEEYYPAKLSGFEEFDDIMEKCAQDRNFANKIAPSTLEGAVVKISDIIAYLGRDRQDAIISKTVTANDFYNEDIGSLNSEIINNLMVNIIENSYGKPYIKMDKKHFAALKESKKDNYEKIYNHAANDARLDVTVKPMMADIYGQLLEDLRLQKTYSPIFTKHINYVKALRNPPKTPYEKNEPNQIVVDFIASMTDDYFIELHKYMFPNADYPVVYRGYFDD
ncbi:MAG: HD domain-containing protein [Clostridia bacterium]|nr:HD domain-containing protein [Clostridia bacterium]